MKIKGSHVINLIQNFRPQKRARQPMRHRTSRELSVENVRRSVKAASAQLVTWPRLTFLVLCHVSPEPVGTIYLKK